MVSVDSHLFLYYPKDDMDRLLAAFHACVGLHVQLFDDQGTLLLSHGRPARYCRMTESCLSDGKTCAGEHLKASRRSIDLGEPYIFCCHSGVYHIIYPLVNRSRMFGFVLLGPFLMDGTDDDLIKHLAKAAEIPTDTVLELYKAAQEIPELSPDQVVQISRLLYYLVNSLVSGSRELQNANRERLLHQSKVSESIHRYKQLDPDIWNHYPFAKEQALIAETKTGNAESARAAFNDLMAQLILFERYDTEGVRLRVLELCSLLSRASIERGADAAMVFELNKRLIRTILNSYTIDEISYRIHDNLDVYAESLFFSSESGNRLIRKATEYVHAHFSEKLLLADVARHVGISEPYLSKLFKKVTGRTFQDYLNTLRVEEAKRLLRETDYLLTDIAIACGFSNQSYFAKIFKKCTGLQPKQYR